MKGIYLRLPEDLVESIKLEAKKKHMTMNLYCLMALGAHKRIMKDVARIIGGKNG